MIDWIDFTDGVSSSNLAQEFSLSQDTWEAFNTVCNQKLGNNNNTTYFSSYSPGVTQQKLALFPLLLNNLSFCLYWERGDYYRIVSKVRNVRDTVPSENLYRIVFGIVNSDINSAFTLFKDNYTDAREYSIGLMETPRHKIRVAIDKERRVVFVLTSRNTELGNLMRRVCSLIPVMFNIDLSKLDYPVPDTLFKLLWKTYAEWHAAFTAWFAQTNWLDQIRLNRIKENLISFQRSRVNVVEKQLAQQESALSQALSSYGQICSKVTELRNQLLGLRQHPNEVSDQVRFILNVPNLHEFTPLQDQLRIALSTPAVNYDLALVRRILVNPSSTLRERIQEVCGTQEDRARLLRIFELIFGEQKYHMYFKYACVITKDQLRAGELDAEYLGMANPHLAAFSCWGSAGPYVLKAYNDGDLVGCLQYVINAVANINFADSTVVRRFVSWMEEYLDSGARIIQDPNTKQFYTIREVLAREADTAGQTNTEQAD